MIIRICLHMLFECVKKTQKTPFLIFLLMSNFKIIYLTCKIVYKKNVNFLFNYNIGKFVWHYFFDNKN